MQSRAVRQCARRARRCAFCCRFGRCRIVPAHRRTARARSGMRMLRSTYVRMHLNGGRVPARRSINSCMCVPIKGRMGSHPSLLRCAHARNAENGASKSACLCVCNNRAVCDGANVSPSKRADGADEIGRWGQLIHANGRRVGKVSA